LAKVLQPFITLFLIVAISREIGVAGFGAYSTIFKYVPVFSIIAGFGLRNLLTREISQNKEDVQRYLMAGSVIAIVCAVVSALVMAVAVTLLSANDMVIYGSILASIALLAIGLADVYEGVISGFEQIKQVGYALLAENVFRVGVSLILIYLGYGILPVVGAFVVGRFLRVTYFYVYISRRFTKPIGPVDFQFLNKLFQKAKVFALTMLCVTVYWNIDGIMLESMRSAEDVGYYSAAYRFLAMAMILVHSYVSSLFPVISNFFKSARGNFEAACRISLRILILATIPIAVVFSLLAEQIIVPLFSSQYLPSVTVLQVLIWGLVPYAVSQVFAYALVASGKQNTDLLVNIGGVASNVILNLILIPRYGFVGASFATLISIHIYVLLQLPFVLTKLINVTAAEILSYGPRFVLTALLMIGFIYLAHSLSVLLVLPLAIAVYLGAIFWTGLVTKNDREMFCRIIGLAT